MIKHGNTQEKPMQRISQAQLTSALAPISAPLQRRLPDEEAQTLAVLLAQMADRYPSQDLQDSLEGYLLDFEDLALKYSLPIVKEALRTLRTKPGQSFFPRPDEVAEEIERQQDERNRAADMSRQQQRRAREIAEFWAWAPGWMADTGNDEAELLRRWPSYRGTKPGALSGDGAAQGSSRTNVVPISARDRKSAAAGDIDDAA
jgi:hypothetical protein